jgi:YidC/Oxa1 family membrane protein insertase
MILAVLQPILGSPLTPLEDALRHVLDWLHSSIGLSWAWSIVGLTVIVRLLLVPLTVRQIHSMQNLQRHAPQMKEIQKKYKADKKRQQEELMKFYRENNINPAASCLPLLAQFPVFIALFFVLRNFSKHPPGGEAAVEGGDFSWLGHNFVPDITAHANAHWSGYLLLVVYVVSQLVSTYLMSATMERSQRILMMVLPVLFVTFLLNFPVGLVIYWVTTNMWTVGQGLITRRLVPRPQPPERRTSRTPPKEVAPAPTVAPEPASASAPANPSQPRRVKRKKKRKARR